MGTTFKKTRSSILKNAEIVRTVLRSSTALLLHGNPEYADDFKTVLNPIIEALEREEYDTEDVVHEAIQDAFFDITQGKPIYVKAAISDLINTMFLLVSTKVTLDEDKILSSEERKAWIRILSGILDIAEMVEKESRN